MRHVRALSPYSQWEREGQNGLQGNKSFLSQYAAGQSLTDKKPMSTQHDEVTLQNIKN